MREFWVASGHHLSQRLADGQLAATPELMIAWLVRPELSPPPEACGPERALHAAMLADPFRPVGADEIEAIKDADARENWSFFIRFRDRLAKAPSVEAAYIELAKADRVDLPPMFLDQLAHLILRNALDGCEDPFVLRAGELFFRSQKASMHEGVLLLADAELVEERQKARAAMMHTSPLTAMLEGDATDLDVMDDENAWTYWSRSDANSMAMNLGGDAKAREGLAQAVAAWVAHLTGARVHVEPIARMEDKDWRWFVGLDPEGTRIGNALWRAQSLKAQDMDRVIAILRMTFADERRVDKRVRGRPVYLFLAMGPDNIVRMKPQNLVAGLPLIDPPASVRSAHREVGVIVRRSKVDNPWIDHVWTPVDVLSQAPHAAPWTTLGAADGGELFYAGPAMIELHVSETGHYRDNLTDGEPYLWVALREVATGSGLELAAVTADPTEGESLFESGLVVGKAPMATDIAAWVARFVDEHHVEREFLKRKRDKSGPDPRKVPGARGQAAPGDAGSK